MKTKNGFTLLELLVVIGIMGLLGTVSISGYRAATQGMADRGAVDSATMFMRAAYQRAQIDRLPTAVIMWNETLRSASQDEPAVVVGKALAIRQAGRISYIDGNNLFDEFSDLDLSYRNTRDSSATASGTMQIWQIKGNGEVHPSLVYDTISVNDSIGRDECLFDASDASGNMTAAPTYTGGWMMSAFTKAQSGGDSASWSVGDAYGFEFQRLTLPQGYIFGEEYQSSTQNPVSDRMYALFKPGRAPSNGSVEIYALRASGKVKVGTTKNPAQEYKSGRTN